MAVHPETFKRAVLRASESRRGARAVLLALLASMDTRKLTARPGKEKLCELTGITMHYIKVNLAKLREAGDIEAVEYATGGRGRATVYAFPRGWAELRRVQEEAETGGEGIPLSSDKGGAKGSPFSADPDPKGGSLGSERGIPKIPPSKGLREEGASGFASGTGQPGVTGAEGAGDPSGDSGGLMAAIGDAGRVQAAPNGEEALWRGIVERIDIPENVRRSWIAPLQLGRVAGGIVELIAPSSFFASYATRNFQEALLASWQSFDRDISRVEIVAAEAASSQKRETT